MNHNFILGLSTNLFRILRNIPPVVDIMRRGNSCNSEFKINLCISTRCFYGRGGIIESKARGREEGDKIYQVVAH